VSEPKAGVESRLAAAAVLGRVLRSGAWSNVLLRDLDRFAPEDRSHIRLLVYESLRRIETVDAAIDAATRRPVATIDDVVVDILRIAVTEAFYTRSPDHAVVDTAVEAVRHAGHAKAAGFVNGVLRSILRAGPSEPAAGIAGGLGYPQWLVDTLTGSWGEGETLAFLSASMSPAPLCVRVRPGGVPPDAAVPGPIAGSWILGQGSPVPPDVAVQDPASVAVVTALGIEAGQSVLDLAAAPGGKTLQIVDAGAGLVVATDRHARRLRSAARRLSGQPVHWVRSDARRPPFASASFDRVLLDAPCSGLGTLRRRPEIRLKVTEDEVSRLAHQQRAMLDAALGLVAPGGRLVYAVCTVTPAETIDVVGGRGGTSPSLAVGRDLGEGRLLAPHLGGTDGMFISVFDR
jgi:16S rRNA (cytosine967-C5)-methyltransferase